MFDWFRNTRVRNKILFGYGICSSSWGWWRGGHPGAGRRADRARDELEG
jgi:hypothetical protein